MKKRFLTDKHPLLQLLVLFVLTGICLVIGQIIGVILIFAAKSDAIHSLQDLQAAAGGFTTDPDNVMTLKWMQLISTVVTFILPAWLFGSVLTGHLSDNKRVPGFLAVVAAVFAMLMAMPGVYWLGEWNKAMHLPQALAGLEQALRAMEDNAAEVTGIFLQMDNIGDLLFNLLLIAALPAIGEELFFRAGLQDTLLRWWKNPHVAILVTAALFSAFHMQFFGFVPRFALGVVLGYLFFWSRSIALSMAAHFANNGTAVLIAWFAGDAEAAPESIGGAETGIYIAVSSVLITTGILLVIRKMTSMDKAPASR